VKMQLTQFMQNSSQFAEQNAYLKKEKNRTLINARISN